MIEIYINNKLTDFSDFDFRLTKNFQGFFGDNLKNYGGTFSTNITFLYSPNNRTIFDRNNIKSIGKFKKYEYYSCRIVKDGTTLSEGRFELEKINSEEIVGIFISNDIDWTASLSNLKLNQLGYVENEPTWTYDFEGRFSMNILNSGDSRNYDILCPTIVYYNTPLSDYKDFTDSQIWDGDFSFPNDFECRSGFYSGERLGLTFEDFPPSVYYRNIIEKIFEGIGLSVYSPLFDTDGFNRLYMPYVGDGYQYNWKKLATVTGDLDSQSQTAKTEFDLYESLPNLDLQNLIIYDPQGRRPIYNDTAKFKFFSCLSYPTLGSYTDYINAYQPINNESQYVVPIDSQYKLSNSSTHRPKMQTFSNLFAGGSQVFSDVDCIESYATQEVNSPKTSAIGDRAYGWDDNVLIFLRKNSSNEFDYTDTFEYLKKWMAGKDKDFINNPSDVIAYISPKRYQLYLDGVITDIKEAVGSPINNWEVDVDVVSHSHSVTSDTSGIKESLSSVNINIDVDLKVNERVEMFWVSLGNIQGDVRDSAFFFREVAASTSLTSNIPTSTFGIENLCGDDLLDISKNLPSISQKEFVQSFMKMYNQSFIVKDKTVFFIPVNDFYDKYPYDITNRVDSTKWESVPLDIPEFINIGYNNDEKDRLLIKNKIGCVSDNVIVGNYGNVNLDFTENIYSDGTKDNTMFYSSTLFTQGNFDNLKQLNDSCLQSIKLDDTTPKYITGGTDSNYEIDLTASTTFSAWFKIDEPNSIIPSTIMSKYDSSLNRGWYLGVRNNGSGNLGQIYFSIQSNSFANSLTFAAEETINLGQWNNVIVTYNGDADLNNTKVYINGVEATINLLQSSDTISTASTVSTSVNFTIGNLQTPTTFAGFDGYISSVKRWNFAFNQETVDIEYESGINEFSVFEDDRLFHWNACDGVWDSPLQLFGEFDYVDRFDPLLDYRSVNVFQANLEDENPFNSFNIVYTTDPVTGVEIVKYYDLRGTIDTTYTLPSIQSEESFNQVLFDNLTYDWDYTPRLLYHLGTLPQFYGVDGSMILDFPSEQDIINFDDSFFVYPTVSSFHNENDNPYQTLRYDVDNGLYDIYFEDLKEFYFEGDLLTLKVLLNPKDFNEISRNKKVIYDGQLFKVSSISDYDPTEIQPTTIKLIRDF